MGGSRGPLDPGILIDSPTPGPVEVTNCYSTGMVSGETKVGGLIGDAEFISTSNCFWDVNASRQAQSDGGTGLTTSLMHTATTFLEAGWDFVDETANGTEDIWKISEGLDYPRLWWELIIE